MEGVRKRRGRELRRETSRAHVPPSPSPFNACHTGCIRSRNRNNLTVEPLLWYSSIQGTPPLREHRIWSQKNVQIIFVFVTSIEETPLLSGHKICSHKNVHIIFVLFPLLKGHLYSGDRKFGSTKKYVNVILVSVTSIEGTPLFRRKGHFFWVPKFGLNILLSGDTLALKK